ncbi:MAG: anti-sigma regulatory factor [Deltaproteobacteria bacterium]|nr:anti-sigma regulatory factor [Deltaproteobacteria bacterium]
MAGQSRVPIVSDHDIVIARQMGRELATRLGFSDGDSVLVATVISELARNIVLYAGAGEILIASIEADTRKGIEVVARDQGPGIGDIERAVQQGFSTSRSLGLGLAGIKRLMDEFEIVSQVGRGTTVTVRKWRR